MKTCNFCGEQKETKVKYFVVKYHNGIKQDNTFHLYDVCLPCEPSFNRFNKFFSSGNVGTFGEIMRLPEKHRKMGNKVGAFFVQYMRMIEKMRYI